MRGYSPELAARMEQVTVDAPLPLAEALRTGRPVWIDQPGQARQRYPEAARFELERESSSPPYRSIVHGRTIGTLGLRFRRTKRVPPEERDFLVALAHQCAQALDRARLFAAERDARRRAEYLGRAAELLAASLNPAATLEEAARLVVPGLADWAFVELLQPNGAITREAIVHRDREREQWARELAALGAARELPVDTVRPRPATRGWASSTRRPLFPGR